MKSYENGLIKQNLFYLFFAFLFQEKIQLFMNYVFGKNFVLVSWMLMRQYVTWSSLNKILLSFINCNTSSTTNFEAETMIWVKAEEIFAMVFMVTESNKNFLPWHFDMWPYNSRWLCMWDFYIRHMRCELKCGRVKDFTYM